MIPIRATNLAKPIVAAAAAVTLGVTVYHGMARVQPAGGPAAVELAESDRLLLEPKLPPLVTRHHHQHAQAASEDDLPELRAQVRTIIDKSLGAVRGCYEMAMDQKPMPEGRVVVQLRIVKWGESGLVSDAEVVRSESTLNAPVTQQCILEALGRLEFPPPSQGQLIITYPFIFKSDPGDDMRLIEPHF
jgi:hypothetical protein